MNFLYNLLKDIIKYFKSKTEDKVVDFNYPERKGISDKTFWCNPRKLEIRLSKGYRVYYEVNRALRVRYRILTHSGDILLLKPN